MTHLKKAIAILSLSTLLTACGGEDTSDSIATDTSNRVTISGSVGDGPIVDAAITVKNANGAVLETTTSDQQANYTVTIEVEPSDFPVTLEATNGIDLVTGTTPDFTLVSVVMNSASTHANLNPHSTIITRTAQFMNGGLSEANLAVAKQAVTSKLNFGLDSDIVSDPITDTVDSSNALVMSHSSEALAEMLRRVSKELGNGVLENEIISALSADLTDGRLDGKGTAGANPKYAAITHAVGLQVLLESMLGDLHVNDLPAEEAITTAIGTILGDSSETANRPSSFRLNYLMFIQAISALSGIQTIDPSVTLRDLMQVLRDLEDGATTEEMTAALEQYSLDLTISSSLDSTIDETVAATEEEVSDINDAANTPEVMENMPPVISGSPPASVAEGTTYSFTPSASDAEGDTLSFSISNLPLWARFNASNGTLEGTPGFNDAGDYNNIVISVSDGSASASLGPFTISVGGTNQSPSISGNPSASVTEGATYSFTPSASDPDGNTLTFTSANLPVWASFNTSNGTLSGTPGYSDAGTYSNIVISVSDGLASASLNAFVITVQDTNRVPSISGTPALSVAEGSAYVFTPTATDPDGDAISFTATNLPAWASFNTSNGSLAGTPGLNDAGVYSDIVISVSDGTASAMLNAFSITVSNTDETPAPTPVPGAATLNSANLSGTSVVLVWTQNNAVPEGGYDIILDGVDTNTQYRTTLLTATIPGMDTSVSHCFAIQARYTDTSQFLASNELCTNAITPSNNVPTISGTPSNSVAEGATYSFTPSASDPDGDSISFSIANRPSWASFNTTNGTLSGTPGYSDAGVYSGIVISVSDGSASASLTPFNISVGGTNQSPSISGSPSSSVAEGATYSFTPSASDPDGDSLSFSIANRPSWASFNTANGSLSGTPGYSDAGVYSGIVISVSDGSASASLTPFNISVANTNRVPSISGSPTVSVTEGEVYSFTPIASDPDGDAISFAATNLPAWASFNTSNGTLTGTPGLNDAGAYNNILISVDDGTATASLNAFSITVNAASSGTGSADLAWDIPTTRTDGTVLVLSEIAGYRIYMGPTSDNLTMFVDLNDGSVTNHSVTGLSPGTYYFSITTYDTGDMESSFSNVASKTIM